MEGTVACLFDRKVGAAPQQENSLQWIKYTNNPVICVGAFAVLDSDHCKRAAKGLPWAFGADVRDKDSRGIGRDFSRP